MTFGIQNSYLEDKNNTKENISNKIRISRDKSLNKMKIKNRTMRTTS